MRYLLILAWISGSAFAQMSIEKEVSLGRQMVLEMEAHQRMIDDTQVLALADRLVKKLVSGESLRVPLELKVIDNPEITVASTLPGGVLLISSGAVLRSESEAEFAALLAHAIGHSQTGLKNSPARLSGNAVPVIFLGGPWGSCDRSPDGTRLILPIAWRARASLTEVQADMLALGYLVNAGYDPRALISAFEHWSRKLRPDEELKAKSDSLARAVTLAVVDTSAFEQMKARLAPATASPRRPLTLYR
jgi:predicted Zn-dependent protease